VGQKQDDLKKHCATLNLKYVDTRGPIGGPILVLGEAPGADEEQHGAPFVGSSGKLLTQLLYEAGIKEQTCWFTNPYKVRPPDNDLEKLPTRGIDYREYEDAFFEQLEETKPTFIICTGNTPLSILCPFTKDRKTGETGITKWRGSLLTSQLLNWPHYVIPVLHPAYLLRDWSEKDTNVFCLKRVQEEFEYWRLNGRLQPLPERELIVAPTSDTVLEYLGECISQPEPVSVDIELIKRRIPTIISFARNPKSAISFSFWDYTDAALPRIWRCMDTLFSKHRIIGQNYTSFDAHWLYRLGFNVSCEQVDDTRIRHNVLWPELSHKLQFMVMQYTREPYYKDEGRNWTAKDGKEQYMRYNCKDTACTYEVFNGQEEEFLVRPELHKFYKDHEQPLAAKFFNVDKRGVLTSANGLKELRTFIADELVVHSKNIETAIGRPVVANADEGKRLGVPHLNVGSPAQVIALLKSRGLKVPKKRGTGRESSGEEELNALFAESNDPVLKEILDIRELNKILSTNVNVKLIDDVYYSVYIVGGTVGGRRSSKSNPIGFGGNGQNIPKHSKLGKKFRRCLVARPGKILVQCDQVGAEDWIINGIIADQTGDRKAIDELLSGTDRHQKLASYIFGVPLDQCSRDAPTIYRYVGKRTRYAGCYGMRGTKFAAVLAKEGFSLPSEYCEFVLKKFHEFDPFIEGVFQKYVEQELINNRLLKDLFGRERQFFGIHPYRDNSKVFREAYSYIPQSTIGDNNGAALLYCETNWPGLALMEVHDAIVLEVDDNVGAVTNAVSLLQMAYDRVLTFPRGFELKVPIEVEIGYNLQDLSRCENLTRVGLTNTYNTLARHQNLQSHSTSGVQQVV
jgi:uracil-DNA glycosylase family 4